MNYKERALALKEETITIRRHLHEFPEIGMQLPETVAYVEQKLIEMGYEPKRIAGFGIVATVGKPGKTVLLRADMDALPMVEESGLPFASQRACAHTCGHDTHTAMLLTAAKMLKESETDLCGTVKLMFQPGEETLEGARAMLEDGLLESPKVDAAIGAHIGTLAPVGLIMYRTGASASSSDTVTISITGKGGHGAHPCDTIDPINVACHLHLALQEIISREVSAEEMVVLTFGMLQAGHAHNIIPERALMRGSLRAYNEKVRAFAKERITQISESLATAFRAKIEVTFGPSTCMLYNDEKVTEVVGGAFKKLFGENNCEDNCHRMSGSEDFAEVAACVPSTYFSLGAGLAEDGYCYGGHHPKVQFDEAALPYGAAAYAEAAAAWLRENALQES